jgi:hypothetical protein
MKPYRHTEAAKEKISNAVKKQWDMGTRKPPMLGKHHSLKTKKKISSANKLVPHYSGEKSPHWQGGKTKTKAGYVLIYKPEHPFANKAGYVFEHRIVIESYLGRYLNLKETPQHINGIKDDNRIKNLILFNKRGIHAAFHKWGYLKQENIVFDGRLL